MTPFSG